MPSSCCAASPGSSWMTAKVRNVTPNRTGIAVASRLPIRRRAGERKSERRPRPYGLIRHAPPPPPTETSSYRMLGVTTTQVSAVVRPGPVTPFAATLAGAKANRNGL